jgi:hypothetical protein
MSTPLDDCLTGTAVARSGEVNDRQIADGDTGPLPGAPVGRQPEPTRGTAPDLRWLGIISCMGSALITLVGAAMVAGHLLAPGDANTMANDKGTPSGYSIAGGSDT